MAKKVILQTAFNKGEVSPRLYGRFLIEQYDNMVKTATNCYIRSQGPIVRRAGSKFINETKDETLEVRLVKYQFNINESYVLEFGNEYIRFYTDGGVVGAPYEISSPYGTADLPNLTWRQQGTSIYIAHPDYTPRKLTRNGAQDWTLKAINFVPTPTYENGYSPATTLTPSATTGLSINLTAGSASFLDGDVGRRISNLSSGETGKAIIVSITSSTVAVCDIVEDFTDTNAIASGDWSIDGSPIADIEVDASIAGNAVNIRSEFVKGTLGDEKAITAVTKANPATVTSNGHGFNNGDKVQIQYVEGMTEINDVVYTVAGSTTNTFQIVGEDSTSHTTYTSGGIARQVFSDIAINAFRSSDVGRFILVHGGVIEITEYISAQHIRGEILKSLNSKDTTGNWTIEDPTWNVTRGYPRAVGIYQERLIFGGTIAQPDTIWFSEINEFESFGLGPDDEDAIELTISSDTSNQINWFAAIRDLIVGTSGGEVSITGDNQGNPITPSRSKTTPRRAYGGEIQNPIVVGNEAIFIQSSERKIRSLYYDFSQDGYRGDDLTYFAEHITENLVKRITYAQDPDDLIYAVLKNGDMLVGAYVREQDVLGWTRYTTDGEYVDVQAISTGENDEVWVVVKRNIGGSDKYYIEQFETGDGTDNVHGYSDSFLTLDNPITVSSVTKANPGVVTTSNAHGLNDGDKVKFIGTTSMTELENTTYIVANKTSTTFEITDLQGNNVDTSAYTTYVASDGELHKLITTVSGLNHLEGKTVQVKADGANHPDKVVSSGSITLDAPTYNVTVGLPYTMTIGTMRFKNSEPIGIAIGQESRWIRPKLMVYSSGVPELNGTLIPSRSTADRMNTKVPLYTGFLEYGQLGWGSTSELSITMSDPFPFNLNAILGTVDTGIK